MDNLTFISSVISSLAWPIAIILIALIFRKSIGRLLASIRKLKYQDLEIDIEKEIQELEKTVRAASKQQLKGDDDQTLSWTLSKLNLSS